MDSQIIIDQQGRLAYKNGELVNTRDYLLTKPYIQRYYDYSTKNVSAINLYVLLRKLGIKNCNEHLQIFNPALIGVDPWDPLLKADVKLAIIAECRINYWYIYREIIRVNNGTTPFDINIGNYTAIYFMLRNMNFFLEASRQLGKTEVITTHSGLEFNFERNIKLAAAHYDSKMGSGNLAKVENALMALPSYLHFWNKNLGKTNKEGKTEIKSRAKSAAKKETLTNSIFNNLIELKVVGKAESDAANTGRGGTIPTWFIDELPHIKFNDVAWGALNQTTKEAKATARANNKPFGYRLLGTPGRLETREGSWMYENVKLSYIPINEKSLEVLDMTEAQLRKYASEKSVNDIFHIKYDFDKVGKDPNWFSERCRGESIPTIRSELLLIWEDKSSASPFPASQLTSLTNHSLHKKSFKYRLKDYIPELMSDVEIKIFPRGEELFDNWLNFFSYNYRNGIVVGLDVSQGLGGDTDSTVYTFVDTHTGCIIATIKDNTLEINDLVILTKGLIELMSDNAIKVAFAIERNDGTSTALLQQIKYMTHIQPYLMAFPAAAWKLDNPNSVVDFEMMDERGENTKYDYGLKIDNKIRTAMMNNIQTMVKKYTRCICIPELVTEIKTLVIYTRKTATGTETKIAAANGKHDDMVMSAAHAYNALFNHSAMLKVRHGIIVDSDNFLLNDGMAAFTLANIKPNSRVSIRPREIGGRLYETFYDNINKKEITKEEAEILLEEEKQDKRDNYMKNDPVKKEEVVVRNEVDEMFKKRLAASASKNIQMVSQQDYELARYGLNQNSALYDEALGKMMSGDY